MTATELILMILGAAIFVISFLIPTNGKSEESGDHVSKEQVKELFHEEIEGARNTVLEMVNETVNYGVEKAERAMERLSNEKISAVSEFSDTVLTDINKNRDEVMFLYDMLNDKHETLKEMVMQVERTTQKANKVNSQLAENLDNQTTQSEDAKVQKQLAQVGRPSKSDEQTDPAFVPFETVKLEKINPDGTVAREAETVSEKNTRKRKKTAKESDASKPELLIEGNVVNHGNNNEKILELHRLNKSNVAIAKELGLGIGEVKLVIDLYEGMK